MRALPLAALLVIRAASGDSAMAGDLERGERLFQRCYACHSVEPGEVAGLQGPNLRGIVGRAIAAQEGFAYSEAMRRFAGQEGTWSAGLLDRFLADPEALVPGTDMSAAPLTDATERTALIAYLEAQD